MPKEVWLPVAVGLAFLTFFVYLIAVNVVEFKVECRSRGGIPVISRYENICYAPGTIIDVGVKGE